MDYEQPSDLFKALAHPTRLHILDLLRAGEMCVCHFEAALDKRQAYISQQLMLLREAGLVEARRDGLKVYYRLNDGRVSKMLDIALGSRPVMGVQPIDGCPCPVCSPVVIPVG
jgi:DNA-binding transcriptional ArsR family regulator